MNQNTGSITAFAPASVANVAVGFDILGFSMDGVGDEVTLSQHPLAGHVEITEVTGIVTEVPKDASKNTAGAALLSLIQELKLGHGFSIQIKKGIPLGSGMGGSAASAVAAVVAANEFLVRNSKPALSVEQMLGFSLQGEKVASGAIHGDNVGPCLQGGLTLVLPLQPMKMVSLPAPQSIYSVLVHPDLKIETRAARGILSRDVTLAKSIEQSAWLAGFLAGCFKNDVQLIRDSMKDVIIEPQRSQLIPGFQEMKKEALRMGALGFSISGSGPSVFAWADSKELADKIGKKISSIFASQNIGSQTWVTPLQANGARIMR